MDGGTAAVERQQKFSEQAVKRNSARVDETSRRGNKFATRILYIYGILSTCFAGVMMLLREVAMRRWRLITRVLFVTRCSVKTSSFHNHRTTGRILFVRTTS